MEFLVVLAVIVVIAKILGVSNFVIILFGLGLIELVIIAMALFFVWCTLNLLFTKKCCANFTRFDTPKKGKFKVAYYMIDGVEYPCIFPRESGLSKNIYDTDKIYKVRLSRIMKKVYDIWAVITCIVGLIFSFSAVAITLSIIKQLGAMM
ncbi:MAG: hypothetical protein K2J37_01600 [Ruminococcus sp.]|nr:hypothetical protein [Ruminococcus sp.]MDE6783843.1 hypothetical protein [Ruminococcus sp.]